MRQELLMLCVNCRKKCKTIFWYESMKQEQRCPTVTKDCYLEFKVQEKEYWTQFTEESCKNINKFILSATTGRIDWRTVFANSELFLQFDRLQIDVQSIKVLKMCKP